MVLQQRPQNLQHGFKTDQAGVDYGRIRADHGTIGALEVAILRLDGAGIGVRATVKQHRAQHVFAEVQLGVLGEAHSLELRHGLLQKAAADQFVGQVVMGFTNQIALQDGGITRIVSVANC